MGGLATGVLDHRLRAERRQDVNLGSGPDYFNQEQRQRFHKGIDHRQEASDITQGQGCLEPLQHIRTFLFDCKIVHLLGLLCYLAPTIKIGDIVIECLTWDVFDVGYGPAKLAKN